MESEARAASRGGVGWMSVVYIVVIIGAALLFRAIQGFGESLTAPAGGTAIASTVGEHGASVAVLPRVLLTLAVLIGLGQVLARLFRLWGQPAVIGEVVAGIVLGPSLLGRFWPEAMHLLIPDRDTDPPRLVLVSLQTIAQLGVMLYMFQVGLELNLRKLGRHAHSAVAISHASIVLPFVSGAAAALWLYPRFSFAEVDFTSFALFLGVAMSITAFPVLARILTDKGLERSDLGVIALSCAATDDVTAWCLLAFVVGVAQAQVHGALLICVGAIAFIACMLLVARPAAERYTAWLDRQGKERAALPIVLAAVLLAAWTTEWIGIHAVFGAFLVGVIIPHESGVAREATLRIRDLTTTLLLPAFFAITGMNTEINLIDGWDKWLACAGIIAVATFGKFGGAYIAARATGIDNRTSAALGALMNTRGLMELIVLNIGLSLGVISPTLYAMMVLMALATTMATAPLLQGILRRSPSGEVVA